jgi:hypothetical protein
MSLCFGKTPARTDAVKFKFGKYFSLEKLPKPPTKFGHHSLINDWGMLGNDSYGDCVWAGAAHETMLWGAEAGTRVRFTDDDALSDYSAVTGFSKLLAWVTDRGTDIEQAASYRRKTGVVDARGKRHKVDAYVAIKTGDVDELVTATYLFGAVGVGLMLPDYAEDQFNNAEAWNVVGEPNGVNGHYVPVVGRNSRGYLLCVTWGRLHAITPYFYQCFSDEVLAYISLEALNQKGLSPEGFNRDALISDLNSLKNS